MSFKSRLTAKRICIVCRQPIPECEGVYWAHFSVLVHQGACNDRIKAASRDYTHSKKGRRVSWRGIAKTLLTIALLLLATPATAQVGPDASVRKALVWDNGRPADITSTVMVGAEIFLLARPCFIERTVQCWRTVALRAGLSVAAAEAVKRLVSRERPNGVDDLSFFSEHTALACLGVWKRGEWMLCPAVGYLRVAADWHWSTDVMTGAAVGGAMATITW